MNTYLQVLKKYAVFSGRASRSEYWVFVLFNITFIVIAIILDNIMGIAMTEVGYGPIYGLYALAILLPGLAVAVRRLHDVGKSGWMILISLIPIIGAIWLIVLMATDSNPEENQYGTNPKDVQINGSITDELILLSIIWTLLVSAFWGIFPRINDEFYSTSTFKMANKIMPIVGGLITFSLAFIVNNKSKRIILIVFGGLVLLYNFYVIVEQFIK
jgi:uncharacterized membrane protein YhaH (DUF805 family)